MRTAVSRMRTRMSHPYYHTFSLPNKAKKVKPRLWAGWSVLIGLCYCFGSHPERETADPDLVPLGIGLDQSICL